MNNKIRSDSASPHTVLVTGASSGIGLATVQLLNEQGFQAIAGVRKPEDAQRIQRDSNGAIDTLLMDVTDDESRRDAVAQLQEKLGEQGLFGLVNNAGISLTCPLEYVSRAHLDAQLQTNLYGPALLTAECLPLIRTAKGRVINVSSGAGEMSIPMLGIYSASKSALGAMTDALRVELRQWGLHAALIVPGEIESAIHEKNLQDLDALSQNLPAEGKTRYADAIERQYQQSRQRNGKAASASTVGREILKALTDSRPRARYFAGRDAKALGLLRPLLGDKVRDFLGGSISGM